MDVFFWGVIWEFQDFECLIINNGVFRLETGDSIFRPTPKALRWAFFLTPNWYQTNPQLLGTLKHGKHEPNKPYLTKKQIIPANSNPNFGEIRFYTKRKPNSTFFISKRSLEHVQTTLGNQYYKQLTNKTKYCFKNSVKTNNFEYYNPTLEQSN